MALYTINDAQLAYGHVALLDHTDFALEEGERVGLIGPSAPHPCSHSAAKGFSGPMVSTVTP